MTSKFSVLFLVLSSKMDLFIFQESAELDTTGISIHDIMSRGQNYSAPSDDEEDDDAGDINSSNDDTDVSSSIGDVDDYITSLADSIKLETEQKNDQE